jgi:tetratricopeptide (TPR) repeat protein
MRCSFALLISVCAFGCSLKADTYAVLPFFNISKDKNLDWIGESVSETVAEALASAGLVALSRDNRIEVYHRLSIRPYALLTKASVIKIGESLDAESVIYGQFEVTPATDLPGKSRGTLQIAARVIDLKHMNAGPEFREFGAIEDLAGLQSHLAWQALRFLMPDRSPSESDFRKRNPAVRVDALESYVRGLVAVNADEKHRLFTQAARLDPRYSQPWFHLGRLHWRKKEYTAAAEWFQKVPPNDVRYREAGFFLGLCRYHTGDFAGAQAAFQTVAGIVPLNEVYNNLGAAESRRNLAGALDNFRKALEGDESDPAYQFNVGYSLWRLGKFPEAAEHFRAVLDRDPSDEVASMLLARSTARSGPRASDTRTEGLERLKTNYEESQYWQLKAVLQAEKP